MGYEKTSGCNKIRKRSRKVVEKVGRSSCSSLLLWDRGEDVWVPTYLCP